MRYLQVGHGMDYTYLNMPEKAWDILGGKLPDIFWKGINTAFMNQQIAAGKTFFSAISNLRFLGEGFKLEVSILKTAGFIEQIINKYSSLFRIE